MELKMFFKKLENNIPVGYLITEDNLRHVLTQIDFDSNPKPADFEKLGYAVISTSDRPKLTPYQTVIESNSKKSNGTWDQTWTVSEVSTAEKKIIFDKKLKDVTDYQKHLLDVYAAQLKDPKETTSELIIIQKWIDATKAIDLTDPFNVVWPTEETINKS
jgi:hypothetical protein